MCKSPILQVERATHSDEAPTTRSSNNKALKEFGKLELTRNTSISDSIKAWNKAPDNIKNCITKGAAKRCIKKYIKTLPI